MNKEMFKWNNRIYYLLGKDKNGINYYLESFSFDCDWYWGGGYIETFTNNNFPSFSKDISSHQHFDSLFFQQKEDGHTAFNKFFVDSPFSNEEKWQIMELFKSFYTARQYSDMLYLGGSHYTHNDCSEIIKNSNEYERINKIVIPEIIKKIYNIMSPKIN